MIRVENLDFSYDGEKVLENINLQIKSNDFLCITGINGAGKSTFVKVLLGFLQPQRGTVKFNGKEKLAYVSQNVLNLSKGLPITVKELVGLSLLTEKGSTKKEKDAKIDSILKNIDILEIRDKKVGELSGGQIQRVYIAKALLKDTNCLILDEPTASIDKKAVKDICCLLGTLNKSGLTVIMITHDVNSIISHATKVLNFVEKTKVVEQTPQKYLEVVKQIHYS